MTTWEELYECIYFYIFQLSYGFLSWKQKYIPNVLEP